MLFGEKIESTLHSYNDFIVTRRTLQSQTEERVKEPLGEGAVSDIREDEENVFDHGGVNRTDGVASFKTVLLNPKETMTRVKTKGSTVCEESSVGSSFDCVR